MNVSRSQVDVDREQSVSRIPAKLEALVGVSDPPPAVEEEPVSPYKAPVIPLDSLRSPPASL